MLRLLGIDPGSIATGLGIVDVTARECRYVHHEVVRAGRGEFPQRLKLIFDGVMQAIREYQPDGVAVESVFVNKNPDSALKLGQARGAAICAAVAMEMPVAEYSPREIKLAVVGRGGAEKQQVQHMIGVLLSLREAIPSDAADALGVAICHAHHLQTRSRMA